MDAATIIATIAKVVQTAVEIGPTVIETIEDAEPFAEAIYNALIAGKPVTQEQIDALENHLAELSAELQEPLPD